MGKAPSAWRLRATLMAHVKGLDRFRRTASSAVSASSCAVTPSVSAASRFGLLGFALTAPALIIALHAFAAEVASARAPAREEEEVFLLLLLLLLLVSTL